MNARISERAARVEKVQRLKEKIQRELEKKQHNVQTLLQRDLLAEDYVFAINEAFALMKLKEFLQEDTSFMHKIESFSDQDTAIYDVSEENLNIWSQDDYLFVETFLMQAAARNFDIFSMLNDRYFGMEFTSIVAKLRYKEMQKEGGITE